jgi:hypothetical protein
MPAAPELAIRRIADWCEARVPAHLRDQVRVELRSRGPAVTIIERRPPYSQDVGPNWSVQPIAQLRYDLTGYWTLHWVDNMDRWHPLQTVAPAVDPVDLLTVIDRNPDGVFSS